MTSFRAGIVDDEAPARDRIRALLAGTPDVEVVFEAADGTQAVEEIRALRPSLLFLDVQMPEVDGFGVIAALAPADRPAGIVFVTAYDAYAIRAFDVNAVDYLLKPYSEERFEDALRRARERIDKPASGPTPLDALLRALSRGPAAERLAIKIADSVQFLKISDIDWLQADGNYTVLHAGSATLRTRERVSDLEERLAPLGFMRVHRSIVVNVDRIFRLEPWSHGEYLIVLRNGTKLNSGRAYNERIRSLMGQA